MKIVKFAFALFGINTYLVYDPETSKCAIIDPGMMNAEEESAVVGFVKRNSLTVTHIINTHLHVDHAIGNAFLKSEFGAPVCAHRGDMPLGCKLSQQAREFGIPGEVSNVEVDRYLDPGDVIEIGEGRLEVIHVPGHSQGSIALWDRKDGFLISGDALFAGSIGRTDLPGGDYDQLIESIRSGLMTLPPDTVVYPGHGPATTIAEELRSNPFLRER